jgi:cyclopropane fatty-acyl-phospholipid synthase-like methyltransferase
MSAFFELGTIVMRRALARYLRDGMRVLEVGTGPYAILAIWAARSYRLKNAAATEIPAWAQRAREAVAQHGAAVDIHNCDLLGHIAGPFDAVWFVPPFIQGSDLIA